MFRKQHSVAWLRERSAWGKRVSDIASAAVRVDRPDGDSAATHKTIASRAERLHHFLQMYQPDMDAVPFPPEYGAALILMPRVQALRLVKVIFCNSQTVLRNPEPEDIARINLDWFVPARWRWELLRKLERDCVAPEGD